LDLRRSLKQQNTERGFLPPRNQIPMKRSL
jgi:hypothetical protein